jgi:CAAX protease family protein
MTTKPAYLIGELVILFVIIPLFLLLTISPFIKIGVVLLGIVYSIWVARKNHLIPLKSLYQIKLGNYWKTILVSFIIIGIASFIIMYYSDPNNLFIVVKKKPLLWIAILIFYALFSAYPQELMYRSFFFKRYADLFKNVNYLLLVNIIVFPLAHVMFKNWLVLLVTLIGGILFALTYNKSKSVLLTSIEHAIYGNWLFTIGMGEMLAFPMPN